MIRETQASNLSPHWPLQLRQILNIDQNGGHVFMFVRLEAGNRLNEEGRLDGSHAGDGAVTGHIVIMQELIRLFNLWSKKQRGFHYE